MKRTVMKSPKGVKYYAVWDKDDNFVKVQLYKTCHSLDIKKRAKAERK